MSKSDKPKMLKPIPKFKTDQEEAEFWDTHDSTEYIDWSKAQRISFPNLKPTPHQEKGKLKPEHADFDVGGHMHSCKGPHCTKDCAAWSYALWTRKLEHTQALKEKLLAEIPDEIIRENPDGSKVAKTHTAYVAAVKRVFSEEK